MLWYGRVNAFGTGSSSGRTLVAYSSLIFVESDTKDDAHTKIKDAFKADLLKKLDESVCSRLEYELEKSSYFNSDKPPYLVVIRK
jgi:hypothetical protein